jgi:hypothetical protein
MHGAGRPTTLIHPRTSEDNPAIFPLVVAVLRRPMLAVPYGSLHGWRTPHRKDRQ